MASAGAGIAILVAVLAFGGAGVIAEAGTVGFLFFIGEIDENPDAEPEPNSVVVGIVWGLMVLGGLIAIVVAGVAGAQMVADAKFCEDCELYMEEKALGELRLGGLKALARALAERNVAVAADLMNAPAGTQGVPKLYHCAECHKGYLEVTASFKANWQDKGDNKDKSETWLAGSIELTPDEVDLFEPHGGPS